MKLRVFLIEALLPQVKSELFLSISENARTHTHVIKYVRALSFSFWVHVVIIYIQRFTAITYHIHITYPTLDRSWLTTSLKRFHLQLIWEYYFLLPVDYLQRLLDFNHIMLHYENLSCLVNVNHSTFEMIIKSLKMQYIICFINI